MDEYKIDVEEEKNKEEKENVQEEPWISEETARIYASELASREETTNNE